MSNLGKYQLPQGWVWATMPDLVGKAGVFVDGDWVETVDQDPNGDVRLIQLADVGDGIYRDRSNRFMTKAKAEGLRCTFLKAGDVLIARMPDPLGRACIFPGDIKPSVTVVDVCIVRSPGGEFDHRWLSHFVNAHPFRSAVAALQSGTTRKRISRGNLATIPLPVPPTPEQERIVTKLDALLSRAAAGEAAARRAQERLKRYRAAVLHAAVTGELTRDWRRTHKPDETGTQLLKRLLQERRGRWEEAELKRLYAAGKSPKDDKWKKRYSEPESPKSNAPPELPKTWGIASIDQLGWTSGYGTSVKCTYEAKGPAVLRIPNVRNSQLDFEDLKFATNPKDISDEDYIAPGDLLLIRTNGSIDLIGRAAVAKTAPQPNCSFASYLIRFRLVGDETLWSWTSLAWGSDLLRLEIRSRAATTAGQYNVSLSGLADLPLPLPPHAEQEALIREVERRLAAADRLATSLDRQLDRARATRQSLLSEAFTGRIVSQNPQDEPASILLDRIRAAGEAAARKPKAKRQTRKPRAKQPPATAKRPRPDGGSEPPKVVAQLALQPSPTSPRQVRLLRLKLYQDFNSLRASDFPLRNIGKPHEKLSPICLVGLNGSGKSNLIEALSEILSHVELSLLPWESITKDQRAVQLCFELEYQLMMPGKGGPTTVRLEKTDQRPVTFKIIRNNKEELVTDTTECLALLPTRVLGYSSGLNETISIPYFRTAAIYSQEVLKQARREKAHPRRELPDVPDSRTFFMDYEFNALILVSNYMLQPRPRLQLFRKNLRIDTLSSFDIRYRSKYQGNKPVELTRELESYLEAIRSCASSVEHAGDKETRVFRFRDPRAAAPRLKAAFENAGNFFRALYKLSLLNPLALSGKKRKFFLRDDARGGQLEKPPTISREDRIFSVENIRVNLTKPKRAIDYAGISDGEHQFMQIFGSVILFEEPGCVFLLDEPETHFNPQ